MELYPYQLAVLAMLLEAKHAGRQTFITYPRRLGRTAVLRAMAVEPKAPVKVWLDEVTNWPTPLRVSRQGCNNVLTRQKVLSKRRGRRAKRRALRKG